MDKSSIKIGDMIMFDDSQCNQYSCLPSISKDKLGPFEVVLVPNNIAVCGDVIIKHPDGWQSDEGMWGKRNIKDHKDIIQQLLYTNDRYWWVFASALSFWCLTDRDIVYINRPNSNEDNAGLDLL